MLKPLGKYRWIWAGGLEPLDTWSPFYGIRQRYLPLVKRTMTQVLIWYLGTPTWINIDPSDIRLEG
jgi:hypothetical protein